MVRRRSCMDGSRMWRKPSSIYCMFWMSRGLKRGCKAVLVSLVWELLASISFLVSLPSGAVVVSPRLRLASDAWQSRRGLKRTV